MPCSFYAIIPQFYAVDLDKLRLRSGAAFVFRAFKDTRNVVVLVFARETESAAVRACLACHGYRVEGDAFGGQEDVVARLRAELREARAELAGAEGSLALREIDLREADMELDDLHEERVEEEVAAAAREREAEARAAEFATLAEMADVYRRLRRRLRAVLEAVPGQVMPQVARVARLDSASEAETTALLRSLRTGRARAGAPLAVGAGAKRRRM